MDCLGEVVPTDDAFVGEMVYARHYSLVYGGHYHCRKVAGICGSAYLVEDNPQFRFLFPEAQHGLDEVVAERAVQPCCAYHHETLAAFGRFKFAGELGSAIHTGRRGGVGLHIGCVVGAVKHIVGGYLHHPTAPLFHRSGQIAWGNGVEPGAQRHVFLRLVHRCIGGTVDYTVYLVPGYIVRHGLLVADVKLLHICIIICMLRKVGFQLLHLVSQLAVTARYKYVHCNVCFVFTRIPTALPCPFYSSRSASPRAWIFPL